MADSRRWVVVGLDNGGTCNNATVLDASGRFLVDHLVETPSCVQDGPDVAVEALAQALDHVLEITGMARGLVRAVGLDTPGPASADGVISSKGSTNFSEPAWRGCDFRGAVEARLGLPVIYNNDGNAAALYAHDMHFGAEAARRSSISVIVGTGLGGGVIEGGRVVQGATGTAGELGHVHIPLHGLLAEGQPLPTCNCGFVGDAESIASLTGIERNLLPYWLTRFEDHELGQMKSLDKAAKLVRAYGEKSDPLAVEIFEQQAMALGRLFTIAANFVDPSAYFLGGGVVEASAPFREWFLSRVREHTALREEQARVVTFAFVPDLDMAGARGAAVAAFESVREAES
jgi:predicted NBD/HSP70 family sugar kinase